MQDTDAPIKDPINNPHDKGYKFLLESKKVFLELLKSFVKQDWVENIDEQNIIKVNKSYILQDFDGKEADLVYQANINGTEVIFYLLMELQSTVDFQMPYRLLLYMTEIWRDIVKNAGTDSELKSFKLPVIIPIVLYNGEGPWTACKSFKETMSGYEIFEENILDFKYILLDVNRYKKEDLLGVTNIIGTVFLLDQTYEPTELINRLHGAIKTIRNLDKDEIRLLKTWIKSILFRNIDSARRKKLEDMIDEEQEAEVMVSNLDRTIKKIKEEGKMEGKIEGEIKGKIEGAAKAKMEIIEKMLRKGKDIEEIFEITGVSKSDIVKKKILLENS